jgi:acetolactate synthase-1/3 small subunit
MRRKERPEGTGCVERMERYVVSILVVNEPGVLSRISGLFSRRGYNIESLTVGRTENPEVSRITVSLSCDTSTLEQIIKQSQKLYVVLGVEELKTKDSVYRELALVKVRANEEARSPIRGVVDIFRASIVDIAPESLIVEITGDGDKIDAFIKLVEPYGIIEMTRTGLTALGRGSQGITGTKAN